MKLAMIGCGAVAPYWKKAAQILSVEIAAVCDESESARKKFTGVPGFTNVNELLNSEIPIDLAVVATPPSSHAEIAKQLISAGVPTVVEKPFSPIWQEIVQVTDLAKEKNVFLSVAFHASKAPDVRWFQENKESLKEEMSDLQGFQCTFLDPYLDPSGIVSNAKRLGGSYMDSGVNAISVLNEIFDLNDFRCMNFQTSILQSETLASETIYSGGGVFGNIITDWTTERNFKCTQLYYKKGTVVLNHSERSASIRTANHWETFSLAAPGLSRMEEHYVGVLADLCEMFDSKRDNLEQSNRIHSLLLRGYV